MKKIFSMLFACIILTGCGKKLKCSMDIKNDNFNINTKYIINYDKNEIKDVRLIYTYNVLNDDKDYSMLLNYIMSDYDEKGIKYDYSSDDSKYVLDVDYDISNLSSDLFDELVGTKDVNTFKKKVIDEGFKCK